MEMKEFIEKFAAQFDEIEVSELTPETRFKELSEWSSLTSLAIMAMMDEEYNIQIKGADIRESSTIADLFEIIQNS